MKGLWKYGLGLPDILSRRVTLRRLEWIGILLPLAFLVLYQYLMRGVGHGLFHSAWGLVILMASLGLAFTVFSRAMFHAIGRLHRDVEKLSRLTNSQNAQLRALNEANLALSEERLVSSILQRVVDLSRELVQAGHAALGVVDGDGEIMAFLTSGIDQKTREAIGPLPSGKGLLGLVMQRTEPLRLGNIADHPASVGFPSAHPPMTTLLGAPIRYRGEAVGSLYLTEKTGGGPFTSEDEEIVRLFANQAAVAIHNARLFEQIEALAVETERTRISHEMHDGLAQVLSYVNTKAQAAETFLAKGDVATAEEQLGELSQAAREVYSDVREGILALRTQVGSGRSLHDVLVEYISEYELQFRISVRLDWQLRRDDMVLSQLQEVQILRIVQEALTNVRKHAEAAEATVSFSERDGELQIEVSDEGKGFNPLAIKRGEWPHLGLQTMQERAEAIGGAFEIQSAPGKGATVRVHLPKAATLPDPGRDL